MYLCAGTSKGSILPTVLNIYYKFLKKTIEHMLMKYAEDTWLGGLLTSWNTNSKFEKILMDLNSGSHPIKWLFIGEKSEILHLNRKKQMHRYKIVLLPSQILPIWKYEDLGSSD